MWSHSEPEGSLFRLLPNNRPVFSNSAEDLELQPTSVGRWGKWALPAFRLTHNLTHYGITIIGNGRTDRRPNSR